MKPIQLLGLTLLLFVFGCEPAGKLPGDQHSDAPADASEQLTMFMDSVFNEAVSRFPQWETSLGRRGHYGEWNDQTDAHELEEIRIYTAELKEMKQRFQLENLNPQAQLSFRMFEEKVKLMQDKEPYLYHSYPVEQMHGIQSSIPSFLINQHRIDSFPDAEAYISRLKGVAPLMRQVVEAMKIREAKGIVIPKFVFPRVIGDCQNILKGFPFQDTDEPSVLLRDFDSKVEALDLSEENLKSLRDKAIIAMEDSLEAGYEHLIDYLGELEENADTRDGAWKFPNGADFYQFSLRKTTTTNMTADEIHELGLSEVARIHGEMREIMEKVEFKGDLKAFFEFMRNDPQFYHPNTEEGRANYLAEVNEAIGKMKVELPKYFGTLPQADLEVKRVEGYREKSAGKAFYNRGTPDGSRPGYYYANLYDMTDMPIYQMEALAFHEAVPGHHMQISIAQELEGLPMFRKNDSYTAYIEGWALYTEFLPKEMGFYQDPYSDFGRLAMELWRACRLVVDTGIHSKMWTRQEAINYLEQNTPNSMGDIVKAIERYIVMPSQATAYKIGMLKIQELRAKAEAEMGDRFDIKAFHDVVLTNGAVPLNVLEELVGEYIGG